MTFKAGDRVKFLKDTGTGTVVRVQGSAHVVILDEDGFERTVPMNELVLNEHAIEAYNLSDKHFTDTSVSPNPAKRYPKALESHEVDLHIEELVEEHRGMSNGEILDIQLRHFERMMNRFRSKKVKKAVFIHGVGQGVLRAEIHEKLQAYADVIFHDASYRKYGYGATEVVFL